MMYPLITFDDNTEIVYSETISGKTKVYVERPDETDGFHSAVCWLPDYRWEKVKGFSENEIKLYQKIIKSKEHEILNLTNQ